MNKYPLWKYLLVLIISVCGAIYALPNLYGEYPAVQISPTRNTAVDAAVLARVEEILKRAKIEYSGTILDSNSAKIRFEDTEIQIRARDLVQQQLGDTFTVALNLLPATPAWLQVLGAKPMYLGLDLRGGVHFLMQVDTQSVVKKSEENLADDLRRALREEKVRYLTVTRAGSGGIEIRFRDEAQREQARQVISKTIGEITLTDSERGGDFLLAVRLSATALQEKKRFALEQNITSLNNRVNELGVAEPIIQQQGEDRIVVQLPGVQDTAKAKEILGRTATLEIMLVDEEHDLAGALNGSVPVGSKIFKSRDGRPILLKNQVIYSGDNIVDSAPGFDSRNNQPIVSITLDARGAAINQRVTGENINKRMAVLYIEIKSEPRLDEQGRPVRDDRGEIVRVQRRIEEVITAPVIRSQLGKRFQIEGIGSVNEANELSLLLRAGAFAAPVDIIEERTVGPSLGQDNIDQGKRAVLIGFVVVVLFMIVYYKAFGLIANVALFMNLMLLVAALSMFQATLTLPGIAGILLTLGMAVDANVLINERIREEIRNGNTPQASIHAGYEKAFGTIADANITTLIAAVMLFNFGTGPIKGFAITLSIGILTTMFSAVMGARAITNLMFGGRKLERVPV
jgi:preprotein translocase subunit SecD